MAPVAASRAGRLTARHAPALVAAAVSTLLLVSCGTADPAESDGADEPYRVLVTGGISAHDQGTFVPPTDHRYQHMGSGHGR
ncbi:hypothetical protein GS483_25280 [Rhodococcus hoagii]|nr:hypothetical protein [Prescottella equi]